MTDIATPFWSRHRGPFRLVVNRPHPIVRKAKIGYSKTEWTKGEIRHGEDALDEARALLTDPRDTIEIVSIWSVSEQQFVGGIRKWEIVTAYS